MSVAGFSDAPSLSLPLAHQLPSYNAYVLFKKDQVCTVYPEILVVINFGHLPEIQPNALLAKFKFGGLLLSADNVKMQLFTDEY